MPQVARAFLLQPVTASYAGAVTPFLGGYGLQRRRVTLLEHVAVAPVAPMAVLVVDCLQTLVFNWPRASGCQVCRFLDLVCPC